EGREYLLGRRRTVRAPDHSVFFFFSSRRRHTSSKRDWSSDVCSSDLCKGARLRPEVLAVTVGGHSIAEVTEMSIREAHAFHDSRSEERRVGKECRTRQLPEQRENRMSEDKSDMWKHERCAARLVETRV